MEKYAVIKLGSKQFLIHEGDVIELERQEKPLKIEVLMYSNGSKNNFGYPEIKEVLVSTTVLEEKLGKKVRVARFKKKSRYERVRGHRQPISIIKIDSISLGGEKKLESKIEEKSDLDKVSKVKKKSAEKASKPKVKKTTKKAVKKLKEGK